MKLLDRTSFIYLIFCYWSDIIWTIIFSFIVFSIKDLIIKNVTETKISEDMTLEKVLVPGTSNDVGFDCNGDDDTKVDKDISNTNKLGILSKRF